MKNQPTETRCSFCHKPKTEALVLISGIDGYICETCVEQAFGIVSEEIGEETSLPKRKTPTPSHKEPTILKPLEIKNDLDEYVIEFHAL